MSRSGFTLVELLVALVIFEVGLLGVVGTLVLASRTVAQASLLERAVGEVESLVDSLSRSPGVGQGQRKTLGGSVSWSVDAAGAANVVFLGDGGTPLFEVSTQVEVLW